MEAPKVEKKRISLSNPKMREARVAPLTNDKFPKKLFTTLEN